MRRKGHDVDALFEPILVITADCPEWSTSTARARVCSFACVFLGVGPRNWWVLLSFAFRTPLRPTACPGKQTHLSDSRLGSGGYA